MPRAPWGFLTSSSKDAWRTQGLIWTSPKVHSSEKGTAAHGVRWAAQDLWHNFIRKWVSLLFEKPKCNFWVILKNYHKCVGCRLIKNYVLIERSDWRSLSSLIYWTQQLFEFIEMMIRSSNSLTGRLATARLYSSLNCLSGTIKLMCLILFIH